MKAAGADGARCTGGNLDHLLEVESLRLAEHRFFAGLADGTLSAPLFRKWLLQDYLYLMNFCAVLEAGAGLAIDAGDRSFLAGLAAQTATAEIAGHRAMARSFKVALPDRLEMSAANPATAAYCAFELDAARSGPFFRFLASIVPCQCGFALIFSGLPQPAGTNPYAPLIRAYRAPAYLAAADRFRTMFERTLGCEDGAQKEAFLVIRQAFAFEHAFATALWNGN